MAKTYYPPKVPYEVDGMHIVSKGALRNKASGTAMAGILGMSPWSSPFQAACSLLGLCREDISDRPAVKVGEALETKIIDYAAKTFTKVGEYFKAEEVYEKREGDHDTWKSDFESDVFSGHVDGIVMDSEGTSYILEVKTSANMEAWENGVPEYYYWQVALYNEFLTQQDHAYVLLGAVNETTYRDPASWVPNENTVAIFDMEIDRKEVKEKLKEVEEWYKTYIENGVTPDYDPSNPGDVEMFEHLRALTRSYDDMKTLVDEYKGLEYAVYLAEDELKDKKARMDDLKETLKDYIIAHGLSSIPTSDGEAYVQVARRQTKKIDTTKMIKDGLDPENYMNISITNVFSYKVKKKKGE